MKGKLPLVISFIVFVGVITYFTFSAAGLYATQSRERLAFCLKQSAELNESANVCSHIQIAADGAYFSQLQQSGLVNTIIILMMGGFAVLGYKVRSLRRELDELKDKANV